MRGPLIVCTVVTRWQRGTELRVLAVRDEIDTRPFDDPGEWWPDQPGVFGGRDRLAGGAWCVSDVATGVSALVLNRTERRTGTPSRGVLPLAAVAAGDSWAEAVDVQEMAAFTLVLAGPAAVTAWTWDANRLQRSDLGPGTHLITTAGVDADTDKARAYRDRVEREDWRDLLTSCTPQDDPAALVIRHPLDAAELEAAGASDGVAYATVFGQLIEARPGHLQVDYSRTPWEPAGWTRVIRDVAPA